LFNSFALPSNAHCRQLLSLFRKTAILQSNHGASEERGEPSPRAFYRWQSTYDLLDLLGSMKSAEHYDSLSRRHTTHTKKTVPP
jgi:hypothetical protein